MNLTEYIILSIIQGITEWLPVSSEGVIVFVLLNCFGKTSAQALSYAIFLHFGTMLAVFLKFKEDFVRAFKFEDVKLIKLLIVTAIFTAVTAIPLLYLVKEFRSGREVTLLIGIMLIITGMVLRIPKAGYRDFRSMNVFDMVLLGLIQGFAVLPGISRSGTTISFLLIRKMNKEDALKISFLVSVPAVLGAVGLEISEAEISLSNALAVVAITLLTGYLTIDVLLRFAKKVDFSKFCMILGAIAIALTLLTS